MTPNPGASFLPGLAPAPIAPGRLTTTVNAWAGDLEHAPAWFVDLDDLDRGRVLTAAVNVDRAEVEGNSRSVVNALKAFGSILGELRGAPASSNEAGQVDAAIAGLLESLNPDHA